MDPSEVQKMIMARVPDLQVNFASFLVCPQCEKIMTSKKKKIVQIAKNLYVHKSCYSPFISARIRDAKKRLEQEIADAAKGTVAVDNAQA